MKEPQPDSQPMNVLFLMDDQHHPEMLSCLRHCPKGTDGKPLVETPNLNRLVSRGVRFEHAYTPTAICGPSRTCFFTGMYPFAHGHYGNNEDASLDANLPNMAAEFRSRGYRTGVFGKCHLPKALDAEFEVVRTHGGGHYSAYLRENECSTEENKCAVTDMRFSSWTNSLPKQHLPETWTADEAIMFLDAVKASGQPFFSWVTFQRPHAPHSPDAESELLVDPERVPLPWEDYEMFEQTKLQPRMGREDFWKLGGWDDPRVFQVAVARYYSLIGLIDEQIGRILDRLEANGQADNTLIVFCPDHGDFGGEFGQLGKNVPVYEQLYKVPLIWCDPTKPQDRGKVVEGLWETVDLLPSLLERMGWDIPARVQGTSFLPAIDGWRPMGKEYVYCETTMCRMLRTREHKIAIHCDHPHEGQLFDMLPRPDELHNRWSDPALRDTRERLTRQMLAHLMRHQQHRSRIEDWEPLPPTRYNRAAGALIQGAGQKPN